MAKRTTKKTKALDVVKFIHRTVELGEMPLAELSKLYDLGFPFPRIVQMCLILRREFPEAVEGAWNGPYIDRAQIVSRLTKFELRMEAETIKSGFGLRQRHTKGQAIRHLLSLEWVAGYAA